MTISPPARRGAATAAGGVLVLGSGLAVGILAADMQHDWAGQEALRQQAAVQAAPAAEPPKPVIVTRTRIRHVTPEPVVVHKKVYRRVQAAPPATTSVARTGGSRTSKAASRPPARSGGSGSAGSAGSSGTRRTTVAPAPVPAPAKAKAPAATTSKTS